MTDRDPTEPPADPTAYLPSVGADLPYDPHRRPATPPAYRDPRTRLEVYRDPDGPADLDRPAPRRRRPAGRDDEYPVSYEGTTALVVICALAVLSLLAVVWWVAASR